MSDLIVRDMTLADLPAVGILAGRLVRAHHAYDAQRFLEPVDPERGYERWFATQLGLADAILLVAATGAEVAGYVYARMEPRSYNELLDACTKLHDIYVDERARARRRRRRAAPRKDVHAARRRKGAPRVVLLTASQTGVAQRLFARVGFRTTMLEMTRDSESPATQGLIPVRARRAGRSSLSGMLPARGRGRASGAPRGPRLSVRRRAARASRSAGAPPAPPVRRRAVRVPQSVANVTSNAVRSTSLPPLETPRFACATASITAMSSE
ncbi:MAG: hypothetical protein KF850_17435 [Labilithrix sp.]|nr:hypothetical protein [Labilithrix sp.]